MIRCTIKLYLNIGVYSNTRMITVRRRTLVPPTRPWKKFYHQTADQPAMDITVLSAFATGEVEGFEVVRVPVIGDW